MADYYGAGKLNKFAQVLEIRETGSGTWEWVSIRDIRVAVEYSQKKNLFSSVGVGARDASLVVWRQEMDLHNAIRLGGDHLFLTSITERNRNQLNISSAVCATMLCQSNVDSDELPSITFPGILTEKYTAAGHEQLDPYALLTMNFVLVVPKAIRLDPGSLVRVGKNDYEVLIPHELDEWKNEYEIRRKADC